MLGLGQATGFSGFKTVVAVGKELCCDSLRQCVIVHFLLIAKRVPFALYNEQWLFECLKVLFAASLACQADEMDTPMRQRLPLWYPVQ